MSFLSILIFIAILIIIILFLRNHGKIGTILFVVIAGVGLIFIIYNISNDTPFFNRDSDGNISLEVPFLSLSSKLLVSSTSHDGTIFELHKGSPPNSFNGFNFRMSAFQETTILYALALRIYTEFNSQQLENSDFCIVKTDNARIIIGGETEETAFCHVFLKEENRGIW